MPPPLGGGNYWEMTHAVFRWKPSPFYSTKSIRWMVGKVGKYETEISVPQTTVDNPGSFINLSRNTYVATGVHDFSE